MTTILMPGIHSLVIFPSSTSTWLQLTQQQQTLLQQFIPRPSVDWQRRWQERFLGKDEWLVTSRQCCSVTSTAYRHWPRDETSQQVLSRRRLVSSQHTLPAALPSSPRACCRQGRHRREISVAHERWSHRNQTSWCQCSRLPTTFAHTPPANHH